MSISETSNERANAKVIGLISTEDWNARFIGHFVSRMTNSENFLSPSLIWGEPEAKREAERECGMKGAAYRAGPFSDDPEGAADDAILYTGEEPYIL